VNVTELVLVRIPDLVTEHGAGVVEQLAEPVAPLLHAPATLVAVAEPSRVTAIVTVAVHFELLPLLEPLSDTVGNMVIVTLLDVLPEAPASSVTVRVTL